MDGEILLVRLFATPFQCGPQENVVDSQGLRQNGVRMSMDALRGCAGDNSHSMETHTQLAHKDCVVPDILHGQP